MAPMRKIIVAAGTIGGIALALWYRAGSETIKTENFDRGRSETAAMSATTARRKPVERPDELSKQRSSSEIVAQSENHLARSDSLQAARHLMVNKNPLAAADMLVRLIESHPEDSESRDELGLLLSNGYLTPEESLPYISRALRAMPNDRLLARDFVNLYNGAGASSEGLAEIRQLIASRPDAKALSIPLASLLAKAGDPDAAVEALQSYLKDEGPSREALVGLENIHLKTQNLAMAIADLKQLIALETTERKRLKLAGKATGGLDEDLRTAHTQLARTLLADNQEGEATAIVAAMKRSGENADTDLLDLLE